MLDTYRQLWALLTSRERKQAILLLFVMLGLGAIEMIGVASIFPLIAVLADPSVVNTNPWLARAYETLGFTSTNAFLIALSAAVFLLIVARTLFTLANSYGMLRYAQMRSHTIGVKVLASYLRRPYSYFLNRHSADMGKTVLSEVEQVINGSLMPALQLVSKVIISAFILVLLVVVDPVVAAVALIGLSVSYGLVYVAIRRYLHVKGKERIAANRARYQIAQEVLGGVKEVKVGGHEQGYLRRYGKASLRFAHLKSQLNLLKEVPRHLLELIAMGGLMILIMALLFQTGGDLGSILPLLAVYAFAGLRLLPAIQVLYQSMVTIRFGAPALEALHQDLFGAEDVVDIKPVPALPLTRDIVLENVSFAYPSAERTALHNVSLRIPANCTVGFVGATGAGKSTIVDLILGLLEPQQGALKVDGTTIDRNNVRNWQRSIGYVPQQIFLADESIAANIALGQPPEKIDLSAVERAARMANLHDFVVNELPKGYDTEVGDRGVRISGGQRQRVGIARALYHAPQVLVLDEATSALDNLTEQAVMESIYGLSRSMTVIMIAHRLSTVRSSDYIFLLDRGHIAGKGDYQSLIESNQHFGKMAEAHGMV